MSAIKKLSEWGAEKTGLPGWTAFRMMAVQGGVMLEGGCFPLISKGKNKGKPNWRKMDKKTRRMLFLDDAEFDQI